MSGDLAAAEREFRNAVATDASVAGFRASLADVLNRQGKRDEAVAVLRDLIARGTSDPNVHGLLGHILAQAQDLEGAEHQFRAAMKYSGDGSSFRAPLADILKRQGRRDEAAALS
jgi:protein O-GlcNAc transferase